MTVLNIQLVPPTREMEGFTRTLSLWVDEVARELTRLSNATTTQSPAVEVVVGQTDLQPKENTVTVWRFQSTGTTTATLAAPSSCKGAVVIIVKETPASTTLTVQSAGATATTPATSLSVSEYNAIVVSDGTTWHKVGEE